MTARIGYISVGILVAICALTGCSGQGGGIAESVSPGAPQGIDMDPSGDGPAAAWVERGATFAIVTWGSGSCPLVATALAAAEPDHITVTFGQSPNDPCTADMAPTTHEFALPEEVTGLPIVVDVNYEDWPHTDTLTLE